MSFKNFRFIVLLLTPVLVVLFFYFKYKIGNPRPIFLPAPDVTKLIDENNQSVDSPFTLPPNLKIGIFAKDLGNVRDLEISPSGIVLASITGAGKVIALADKDNDGKADQVKDVLTGLNRPHGLAFYLDKLYVVEETRVVRYYWDKDSLSATPDKFLFSLPTGGGHFTRSIVFDNKGTMYVSIGSSCDSCFENHEWLGAVVSSDVDGNNPKLYAKGLRNTTFLTVNPITQTVWATEMGRDFLGDSLPPDEINILKLGDFGWPVCYGDKTHDSSFDPEKKYADRCRQSIAPIYNICAHCAPLGLAFINSPKLPQAWQGDLLVALHGSWNSSKPVGYKVIRLDVEDEEVVGEEDFLTGFLQSEELRPDQTLGRPVDLVFNKNGDLLISDDKAGVIYRVSTE